MSDNRQTTQPTAKGWQRTAKIVLKWTWIPLACVVALIIGLTIGYVYIGKQPMNEVFDIATWRHMFDLVFAEA